MDDTARMEKPVVSPGSITPVKVPVADLPAGFKIKGTITEAWKWTDKLGENYLVTSLVEPYDDKKKNEFGEEGRSAELYAVHFTGTSPQYKELWKLQDGVQGCPFDITNNFVPGSTTITDLDQNGIAEVKVQYLTACRSDVSPAELKLVMYENGVKRSLTGLSWLAYSPDLKFEVTENNVNLETLPKAKNEEDEMLRTFGRYETEKDFVNAPPVFIQYARSEWMKFVREKIGE